MAASKYYVILGKNNRQLTLSDTQAHSETPCRASAKYKGVRFPTCVCMPCFNIHLAHRKSKGDQVAVMPEGWTPYATHGKQGA